MNIACIGWGSLIWRPGGLHAQNFWFNDGPLLPIEFARQSQDGRLTLVITANSALVRTFWTLMLTSSVAEALESLRIREGILQKNISTALGNVTVNDKSSEESESSKRIRVWMHQTGLDAVIWTNLPPKFNDQLNLAPTEDQALAYLNSLDGNCRRHACEYVRKTPLQIDTPFRRAFEAKLGWTFLPS
jgi:hypothetical protein